MTHNSKDNIIFKKQYMNMEELWKNKLSNTKIIHSIEIE